MATQFRAEHKHNATARAWLEFPSAADEFAAFDDIYNSQELWRELCNLVLSVEHDLADAKGYKDLEPAISPKSGDDEAVESLYHLHRRKMEHFNRAVYKLIKVQDLVNRLLHEALGGNLVATDLPTWEKNTLTRKNIAKELDRKAANKQLEEGVRNAIVDALALPTLVPHHNITNEYRNRLTHHITPSVDYSMFYASFVLGSRSRSVTLKETLHPGWLLIMAGYQSTSRLQSCIKLLWSILTLSSICLRA